MYNIFGLPPSSKGILQEYFATSSSTTATCTWEKPKRNGFTFIIAIGAGGGGAGGVSGSSATSKNGGGGGGSGGITILLIPTALLPDTLFIKVGIGGAGGAVGSTGGTGSATTVGLAPISNTVYNFISLSGGGGGTTTAGGAAGGFNSVTNACNLAITVWNSVAGEAGTTPASGAGTVNNQILSTTFLHAGCAGGSTNTTTNYVGGGYVNTNTWYSNNIPGGAILGGNGSSGFYLRPPENPFISFGGTGGGTNYAGTGGNGGVGSIGSGGGGGGAGLTGGVGGAGGGGYVAILSV